MFFKPTCCHQYVILSIQAVVPVPGLTRYAFTSEGFFTLPLLDLYRQCRSSSQGKNKV